MLILKIVLLIQYFKPVYFLAKINLNYARQQKSCCFYDGNVVFSKRARRKGIKRFISCNVLLWPSVLGRWPDPNIAGYKSLQTGRQKRLHLRFCLFCFFFVSTKVLLYLIYQIASITSFSKASFKQHTTSLVFLHLYTSFFYQLCNVFLKTGCFSAFFSKQKKNSQELKRVGSRQ